MNRAAGTTRLLGWFVGLFVAGVLALAVAAVSIWRLRCEGFGCLGIGIAWFAWVAAFVVVLVGGLVLQSRPSLGSIAARTTRGALVAQAVVALVAIAAWLARSAT